MAADHLRRPPTVDGVGFIRFEAPEMIIDVVIRLEAYARCRPTLHSAFVIIEGRRQRNRNVLSVTAAMIEDV
ncbi:MAG: hypothetical protein KA764_15650 [Anaerolineales bacterium]|nr:hypothetical protein [Anaerolineales bacterium]